MDKLNGYRIKLNRLRSNAGLRQLRHLESDGVCVRYEGRWMVNLSSNDYMGLGADRELWTEFLRRECQTENFGGGSCSSRLLTGNFPAYDSLENRLRQLYASEAATVLNSGYHANVGILPALSGPKDLILADKLVHASLIDGVRLSHARTIRFRHNDTDHLESLLVKHREDYEQVFIVTESVFSMDGDRADLCRLVELKEKYSSFLYVDEAHAFGVYGGKGLGMCEEAGLTDRIDLIVGTFGKAAASQGAFLISTSVVKEYLINTMRPLIFTTALPPVSVRWTEYVLERLLLMKQQRRRLSEMGERLRNTLRENGLRTAGDTHVVPVIVGGNRRADELSRIFGDNGFFALPIRTPTVPAGSERIRISLTAALKDEHIEKLTKLCARIG